MIAIPWLFNSVVQEQLWSYLSSCCIAESVVSGTPLDSVLVCLKKRSVYSFLFVFEDLKNVKCKDAM